jgi:hypothetical protein
MCYRGTSLRAMEIMDNDENIRGIHEKFRNWV